MNTDIETLKTFYALVDDPKKSEIDLAPYFSERCRDFDRAPQSPKSLSDSEAHLAFFSKLKRGYSTFSHTLNLVERTDSGKYIVYWRFEGVRAGAFFGVPASGKRVATNGIDIYTLENGQFTEQRHCEDVAGLMAQISTKRR